ncbi:metal ABC transporter solute-binding protein, Zn/Mn family [Mycobacterium angelicum]|uniref:ABC transporter substrate-binding protein n=1 Tax=Mycobacterium angelicum TaxID=470074 RepID=A0A1W9ZIV9_MYCAN|nr:zinc ABC transporter substrate-binding protein [Mycobacterium angelicum]MCV7199423.1 zinc ABC transporter substrate-binding protein [Mycobacterium angelicum]ORA16012.1 ABC transporter substrate-binding protein [Mycobacterium angelicum]
MVFAAVLVCVLGAPILTGCGSDGPAHPGATTVVASTDVWGSVARAVAGDRLTVRSILTGAQADPHSYQASPADAAAIADARLVIYNGGGYDPWVDRVLAGHPDIQSIDAYSLLGATTGRPDEHVFYNLSVVKAVAVSIAARLATIDPANAGYYHANAADFGRGADAVATAEQAIATNYPAAGVIATEPVVNYLLAASGLVNRAPSTFTEADENDDDPSPADMAAILDLIDRREVSALLINPQTSSAAINGLQAAARRAGVPVAEVTETLPHGTDYLTWQRDTVDQLTAALRSNR